MEIVSNFTKDNKKKRREFEKELDNLPSKEVVLFLSEENLELLKDYKKYCGYPFSDTINMLCKRNLDEFENILPNETLSWLDSVDKFLDKDNYAKIKEYMDGFVQIDKGKENKRGRYEDVHVYIERELLSRIDNKIKTYAIFKKWTRDKIITYIIALDNLKELDISTRESIKRRYFYYKKQFIEYSDEINKNFNKINKAILSDVSDEFLKTSKVGEFIDYLSSAESAYLLLVEKKKIEKIQEVKDIVDDFSKILNDERFEVIKKYLKKINNDIYLEIESKLYFVNEMLNKLYGLISEYEIKN